MNYDGNGMLLVDDKPVNPPTLAEAKLARLKNGLTFYYWDGTTWQTGVLGSGEHIESVTGPTVDNTDPLNPIVGLQTAAETSVVDADDNYTSTDVEGALAEIAVNIAGINHTTINGIELKSTGVLHQYTVEIKWTDANGVTQITTDPTPITVSGSSLIQSIADTGTIDLTVSAEGELKGEVIIQNNDPYVLLTKTAVGLKVTSQMKDIGSKLTTSYPSFYLTISNNQKNFNDKVYNTILAIEEKPPVYLSRSEATAALGINKRFIYAPANLDAAIDGTEAWT